MKKLVIYSSAVLIALLLVVGSFAFNVSSSTVAFAQEGTAVPDDTQSAPVVQTTQEDDDNDFPWGLLGLAGLAGLAGLRRREEPTRVVENASGVRTYDKK